MLNKAPITPTLPAVDLERAKTFYKDKLGLKESDAYGDLGNEAALFEGGNGTLVFLYKRGETKADHTVLGFNVTDVEKTVEELTANGIAFEQYDFPGVKTNEKGIAELSGSKSDWFKDSEGNILSVNQM